MSEVRVEWRWRHPWIKTRAIGLAGHIYALAPVLALAIVNAGIWLARPEVRTNVGSWQRISVQINATYDDDDDGNPIWSFSPVFP